jgi:hypothetical protein
MALIIRERIAELGTALFGLGLTAEKEANQTMRLWSAVAELDSYYRELHNIRLTVPSDASNQFLNEAERILRLVKEAQAMRSCSHFKEILSPGEEKKACIICELHIQSVIVDLRIRKGWLRDLLRRFWIPEHGRYLLDRFEAIRSILGAITDLHH